jgi:hypothetical protein
MLREFGCRTRHRAVTTLVLLARRVDVRTPLTSNSLAVDQSWHEYDCGMYMMDGAGMFGASHNHVPTSMITIDFERVNSSRHDCYSLFTVYHPP